MRDKQNTLALCRQILHDLHQFLNLLRSQYCSRLIKNQDLIVTIQHLQDLGSLLHTNRDILNQSIWLYLKSILLR